MKRLRPTAIFAAAWALSTLGSFGFEAAARAAGPDPAVEAERVLASVDTNETRAIVQDPVAKAHAAQQRAQSARGAGDLQHATELDALALTWAQVAADLQRTAASEKQLGEAQRSVAELEQKATRTQALIEQTIARRGRAEQNLKTVTAATNASTSASPSPKPPKEPAAPKSKPSNPVVKP